MAKKKTAPKTHMCKACKKKITVAKGVKVPRGKESKMQKKKGSSNAGEYKDVAPSKFCGAAGGASKYSYPVNTKKRARAALAYARNAPNPAGIRKCVKKKFPSVGAKKKGKK